MIRVVLFLFLIFPLSATAQNRLRVFLVADRINLGEVEITFQEKPSPYRIVKNGLAAVLQPVVKEDKWMRFEVATNGQAEVDPSELERIGIRASFDENSLELRCEIPLEIRRLQDLSFAGDFGKRGTRLETDPGAGYLNMNVLGGVTDSDQDALKGSDPLQGQVELVQHLGPITFETVGFYREREMHPWQRGDTGLVTDFEEAQTRLRVGDSSPNVVGFMNSVPSGGVHLSKQFNIDPARPSTGTRGAILQIAKPSLVQISVNGVLLMQVRLSPGPFNLRDLPLLVGRNRVHVQILDDYGGNEEFDVDLFFDGELLGRGLHDFSYFAGKPWYEQDRERRYLSPTFLSATHRYGLTERITAGANAQGFESRNAFGLTLGTLTDLGTFQADLARSRSEGESDWGDRLRFRSVDQDAGLFRRTRFLADYEHRGSRFSPVTVAPPSWPDSVARLEGFAQTSLTDRVSFGCGGGYQWGQNGFEDARLYRALLQTAPARELRLDFSYNKIVRDEATEQWLLTLTWFDPTGLASANLQYDSLAKQSLLSVHKNAARTNDDFAADLNWQRGEDSSQIDARADYRASKGEIFLRQQSRMQGSSRFHDTQIGAGTALAWAKGRGAFSRPIHDSFAILAANEMPPEGILYVNPGSVGSEARMESWKTLVFPDLASYQEASLRVDSTALPPGYLLEREAYVLRPGYRGGVYVDLGLSKRVLVRGRLVRTNATALKFAAGEIRDEQGRLVSESFFTDGEGAFIIEPMPAGRYELKLREPGWKTIRLEVPDQGTELQLNDVAVIREEGT